MKINKGHQNLIKDKEMKEGPKQKVDSSAQLDWEKKFDRKFSKWEGGSESFASILNVERERIKSFIRNLLNETREKERADLMGKFDNLLNILKSGL